MEAILGSIISAVSLLSKPIKSLYVWLVRKKGKCIHSLERTTGGFEIPNRTYVGRRIECRGWIKDYGRNQHFWLVVKIDDLFWPKEGEVKVKEGKWTKIVYEGGRPPNGKFTIALYAVNEYGHNTILKWIDETRKTGNYYGLSDVDGILCIASLDLVLNE